MIDTPIYRKISQALGQLKSVFVVITNNDSNKDSINTVCEEAQSKMPGFVSEILHFDIKSIFPCGYVFIGCRAGK